MTTTITASPVQIVVGGVCLGAGIYVGFKATQMSVELAEAGVDKIKAKIAAKKAEKEKAEAAKKLGEDAAQRFETLVAELTPEGTSKEVGEMLNKMAEAASELSASIAEEMTAEQPVVEEAAVEEPVAAETVLEELLVEVMSEREDLLPTEVAAIVESCDRATAVMDQLIEVAAASDPVISPEEIKMRTEKVLLNLAEELGKELIMNPALAMEPEFGYSDYTTGPVEAAAKPVLTVKLGDILLEKQHVPKPHHTNKKGVYRSRR